MNRFALLSLYRSVTRHKLYAALNIGGLAVGIAVFLVLFLFVRFETGFDRILPGAERVWTVQRTLQFGTAPPVDIPARFELLPLLQSDFPSLEGARMQTGRGAVQSGQIAVEEQIGLVDANYFDLFPVPVVAGDPGEALSGPDGAVVTESMVEKYLLPGDAIGQTIEVRMEEDTRLLRVAAVIADLPAQMTYRNDIFLRMPAEADDLTFFGGPVTFFSFPDEAAARDLIAKLPAFEKRNPDPSFVGPPDLLKVEQEVVPLSSLHLKEPRDRMVVATLGIVGIVALLLAMVNYINLATARADIRAREVAMRKVLGAPRSALIGQFLAESLLAAGLAGLIALALVELALPFVNAAGGTDLAIRYGGTEGILLPLIAVVLVAGLVAGLYPAFVLSRFRPASVLSSNQSPGTGRRGRWLRAGLVTAQFAIAIALMIATGILLAQARHLQTYDLGFERDGLIMVPAFADPMLDTAQRTAIRREIAALPEVVGTTGSAIAPGGGSFSIRTVSREDGEEPVEILEGEVGEGFLDIYGARLVAGRSFDPGRFPADVMPPDVVTTKGPLRRDARTLNAVVNRSAVRSLGFADPDAAIGQPIPVGDKITIIGVIDDVRFDNPREKIAPIAYYLRTDEGFAPNLAIRYTGEDGPLIAKLQSIWQERAGQVPFNGLTVNRTLYERFYEADLQRSRLFAIGSVFAVFIGCLGLFGLASFSTARRVKEIGIRKSLGASGSDIVRLLVGQFMRPVLVANLIAWPLAFFAMRQWLSGFADRIELSPWFFIGASALAIVIAVLTVLGQSLRASRTPPAWALRHD